MTIFCNNLARNDITLAIVTANGVSNPVYPDSLRILLHDLARNVGHFSARYEQRRKAVRNILRNGSYKPAGRGKPASEYLVRMIGEDETLPTINTVVDIFNFLSARYQFPISVWDRSICSTDVYHFRLGRSDESFVFNASGQRIELADLVVGCCSNRDQPFVSPVKDSHEAKVSALTNHIAAAIYLPASERGQESDDLLEHARELLTESGGSVDVTTDYVPSGEEILLAEAAGGQ